jgi:putative membrane protein insertion efficiency factor
MTVPLAGSPGTPAATDAAPARRRPRWRLVALLLVLLVAADLTRAPARQLSARALLAAIHGYQATLSPRLGAAGVRCRFRPTCSHYAQGAIRKDGALVGSLRAAWRVARCGPWTRAGTVDPP